MNKLLSKEGGAANASKWRSRLGVPDFGVKVRLGGGQTETRNVDGRKRCVGSCAHDKRGRAREAGRESERGSEGERERQKERVRVC